MENCSRTAAPQPGDVCLTWITGRTGVWISVMQWLTGDGGLRPWRRISPNLPRGYPTHAAAVLPDGRVLEARPGGAVINSIGRYRRRPVLYANIPLSEEQRRLVVELAETYVGTPYNWLDYLYLGLWRIRVRPGWLRSAIQENGRMICSQLCDSLLERVGCHLFTDGRLHQDVTPGDLYRLFDSKGWWLKDPNGS